MDINELAEMICSKYFGHLDDKSFPQTKISEIT